ncbi:PAS domain S-box protein [Halosolutus halophilus]|uniref:PAS domain S-box protein n=1 Tax=Halosolutus halophilus TaxID=1552990 RepID=UPI00223503DD|nr:PAS domain S-box protein [Halosolutus halophilus]
MGSSSPTDATHHTRIRRQEVVSELGQQALETDDLDQLLHDATAAVAETLDTEYCGVLELVPGEDEGVLRRGVGWQAGLVGETTVPTDRGSQTGDTLRTGEPVLVDDVRADDRFSAPELLTDHDVVSGVSVRIGSIDDPWGVVGAYTTEQREFTGSEATFVRHVANLLASAIENERERRELERERKRQERRFEAIFEDPNILVGLLEPDGTVLDINGTAMEYVDADLEDVTGEPFWETPWWGTGDEVRADVERWTERAADGEYVDFEADLTRPDGQRYTLNGVFRPVTDDEGDVVSVVVSDRDITERRERERRLSRLMDNVPGMVYRCRNERGWPMEFVSDACDELTGYDPEAIERGDVSWGTDVMVQADCQKLWETIQREAGEGETFSETYRIETADGDQRWVRDYGRGVFDDAGNLVELEGIVADVTERKRLESELEESEQRYRTLVENFPNGAVALVDEDLRYRTVGGDPVDVAGVTTEEVEGKPIRDALPSGLADELGPRYEAALDGESSEFETTSNGRVYDFQVVPVRDDDGEVFAALGMSQDVTERTEIQRQLEESERRYRTLIDHFPNGAVGLFDEDLRYQVAGGRAFDDIEDSTESVVGKTLRERYPPDLADRLEPKFRAALEGETNAFEMELHGQDWMAYTVPVTDDEGEISGGMIMVQDISEQKDRERELRERKTHLERYETIVEVVNDGVYVVDADGRFTMVNETYAEMLGYTPEELVGADVSIVVDDDVVDRVEELQTATVEGRVDRPTMEAELRTADGDRLPVEATFATVPGDDSTWYRVGVVRDISERKARERRIEESERRYRTLVENFPNGSVGMFDDDLRYTAVGGQLLDTLGLSPEDRIGRRISEIHSDELLAEIEPYFHAALEGEENSFELGFADRYLHAHTLPVRNADGEIFAGMLVVQDDTERREYQRKLEESNERLEQFAYAASHDLQEPLRMVTSYLRLLENRYGDAFDEDGEEFLEFAVDGADRMREMIDGLLEYSRVETRGDPFEPVDLDAVVDEVLADLQFRIDESDAEITTAELPRVEGDASQLRQVVQNLLSNAIAYSGDEPPRVHVGADRRGGKWVISVRDEGIGIDPADQDRVFTIFDRLHSREEYEGTGIGLALCERIVERHGGDIWVESEPGEGATFSFTLPASDDR